jgi:hypothetical protein
MKARHLLRAALVAPALSAAACAPRGLPVYRPTAPYIIDDDDEARANARRRLAERQYCADLANFETARRERRRTTNQALAFIGTGLTLAGATVLVGNQLANDPSKPANIVGTSLIAAGAAAFAGWAFNEGFFPLTSKVERYIEAAQSTEPQQVCRPPTEPEHQTVRSIAQPTPDSAP